MAEKYDRTAGIAAVKAQYEVIGLPATDETCADAWDRAPDFLKEEILQRGATSLAEQKKAFERWQSEDPNGVALLELAKRLAAAVKQKPETDLTVDQVLELMQTAEISCSRAVATELLASLDDEGKASFRKLIDMPADIRKASFERFQKANQRKVSDARLMIAIANVLTPA